MRGQAINAKSNLLLCHAFVFRHFFFGCGCTRPRITLFIVLVSSTLRMMVFSLSGRPFVLSRKYQILLNNALHATCVVQGTNSPVAIHFQRWNFVSCCCNPPGEVHLPNVRQKLAIKIAGQNSSRFRYIIFVSLYELRVRFVKTNSPRFLHFKM